MSVFQYKGRTEAGKRCRGYIIAETPKAARIELSERGIISETLDTAVFVGKFTKKSRASFYADAGMLLGQGFTIEEALTLLIEENQGIEAGILTALRDRIMGGEKLSAAIAALSGDIPGFEQAALETAEESGSQDKLLMRLAEFMERDREIRERVRSALVYPTAVLTLAFFLLILMIFVILPKAESMFPAGKGGDALAMAKAAPIVLGILFVSIAALVLSFSFMAARARRSKKDAKRYEQVLLRLPLVRKLMPLLWTSRFASTMGLLLRAGQTPQASIAPSGTATGSAIVSEMANDAAEKVRTGESLAKAISKIDPISHHLSAWIGVGEKAGALGDMLEKASERTAKEYEKILMRMLSMLEPALVAIVGLIVLFVALSVIRPMLDLTTSGV